MFPGFGKIWKHKGHSGFQMNLNVSRMPLVFPRFLELSEHFWKHKAHATVYNLAKTVDPIDLIGSDRDSSL